MRQGGFTEELLLFVVLSVAVVPERLSVLADLLADGALEPARALQVLTLHVDPQVSLTTKAQDGIPPLKRQRQEQREDRILILMVFARHFK